MDLTVEEDGYDSSTGSVDEDAELELSCALHDLALRVKNFEANMIGRFRQDLDESDDDEEIAEDIDQFEEEPGARFYGRNRRGGGRRRRSSEFKMARPPHEDDDEDEGLSSDGEDRPEARGSLDLESSEEWDSQEEKEELCELKQNIAKLLQSMQEEAKALDDNQTECKV